MIYTIPQRMAATLSTELTAPNKRVYTQPLGLFIDNEFHASSDRGTITTINPTYVLAQPCLIVSCF